MPAIRRGDRRFFRIDFFKAITGFAAPGKRARPANAREKENKTGFIKIGKYKRRFAPE